MNTFLIVELDIVQKNSAKYVGENLESLRKIISRIKLNIKNQEECEALGGASSDVCSLIRIADDESLTLQYNYNDFATSNCSSSVVSLSGVPECLFTTLLEKVRFVFSQNGSVSIVLFRAKTKLRYL